MEELTITMDTRLLLEALKKHKFRFTKAYEAMLKAYEKKTKVYRKRFDEYVKKVSAKKAPKVEPIPPTKPIDRTKSYDLYIQMLEKHRGSLISVSESLFRSLWKDEWDWMSSHMRALQSFAEDDAEVATILSTYQV